MNLDVILPKDRIDLILQCYIIDKSSHKSRPNMNITQLLTQYGLSKNESLVYTALIKLTEASAYSVSKETKIPKTTVYQVLDTLKDKGLISKSTVNNSAYYTAESTNRFVSTANEKLDLAKMIVPALESVRQTKNEAGPSVKFYVGEEGAKRAFEDVLDTLKKNTEKKIYAVVDQDMDKFLPRYLPNWLQRREKMGIYTKLLTASDDNMTEPTIFNTNSLRETRLIPKEYIFSTSMDIYANKIAIFSHRDNEPHAIIIESEYIAETLKGFFEFMWKFAEIPKHTES